VDAGAVPLLVLCIQEPEITLKRISASSMGDICKHSPELAQSVVDAGAVAYLAPLILHPDAKLKRQVCGALAHISKHSVDLAEVVVEAEIFPNILNCLKDTDTMVRKNAAMCIREIAKHTPELAKLIVNSGGAAALVDYVFEAHGNNKLPGIMAIGYIAAFSETLALAVIVSKAIPPLKDALVTEPEDHIKAACAWTLGQIGRHTPDHARALAEGDVLRHLLACMVHEESSEDLKTKSKRALKAILAKCTHLQALQPLLRDSPVKVQKYVLRQFAQLLPHDVEARRSFVQSGGLQFLQELNETVGGKLTEFITQINNCYPPEVVEFYSPNYSKTLLQKIDEYQPGWSASLCSFACLRAIAVAGALHPRQCTSIAPPAPKLIYLLSPIQQMLLKLPDRWYARGAGDLWGFAWELFACVRAMAPSFVQILTH
jgi:3-methyladenine DNA glycosylase AlkD